MSGIPRYAGEILRRLGPLCTVISGRVAGGKAGHLWEQLALPAALRGRVLWSPSNTGPLLVRRQVLTVHDVAFVDRPECFHPKFVAWYQWLIPRLVRRVERVITISEYSRGRLADVCRIDPSRISVIYNGVDAKFFQRVAATGIDVLRRYDLDRGYILSVGSVEPRKNLNHLFRAWDIVRGKFPGVTLAVAGATAVSCFNGSGISSIPAQTRLLGFVSDDDLPQLYSSALAFVFPSIYEGFGLPPLEAMACGTPVVCSNATSLPEVVGEAALLVDPADPESIADGIFRVLTDTDLSVELRRRGLARASQFTWDRTAEAMRAVFADVR